jgi:hypothetical protein
MVECEIVVYNKVMCDLTMATDANANEHDGGCSRYK